MKPSAENLGSAEPQDLLFFLHGLPSSVVAALLLRRPALSSE